MRYNLTGLRLRAALGVVGCGFSAGATAGFAVGMSKPALAEFEIQESQVEKGEVEFEYRGAVHWGFPKTEKEEAEDGEEGERSREEDEGPLRQSHDFEMQYGHHRAMAVLHARSPPTSLSSENFNVSSVELETAI